MGERSYYISEIHYLVICMYNVATCDICSCRKPSHHLMRGEVSCSLGHQCHVTIYACFCRFLKVCAIEATKKMGTRSHIIYIYEGTLHILVDQ